MAKSMTHLNGNLLCAIDVETTGFNAGYHDLVQVCVLPLDSKMQPLKSVIPFYLLLQPKRPENAEPEALRVNGLDLATLQVDGIEAYKACELFEEWFEKLELAPFKKIAPLGQNYMFDRSFLIEWLGPKSYSDFFSYHVRDTIAAAYYINDRADFHNEPIPFPKVNLGYLASSLKVEHDRAHDAMSDCVVTAEVYRRMMNVIA